MHPLTIAGMRKAHNEQPPILVLQDAAQRTLEIEIGLCEMLAIQLALDKAAAGGRPLTHDLLLSIAEHLEAEIARLLIDDVSRGTYYARLILATSEGEISLDCRPSDGIALALRANAPILAAENVMQGDDDAASPQSDAP